MALRYSYEGPDRGYLLCSQSCGSDSENRPGNFFAHSLVIEPKEFTKLPPIFYWQSLFWQREDPVTRPDIDSLPPVSMTDVEVGSKIETEGVWDFLAQGERREHLYKLLCAIIHSAKTFRRVVILDTTENVAWWIAAVSTLLPPDYRPLLSFATYHHDPVVCHYLITGTTLEQFQGSSQAYFVLNAGSGTTGEVQDLPYARRIARAAQPDQYATLLTLFRDYVGRFHTPTAIDEQLDMISLYAAFHEPRSDAPLASEELQALETALDSFEQPRESDVRELDRLEEILTQAENQQGSSTKLRKALERVRVLLRKLDAPMAKIGGNEKPITPLGSEVPDVVHAGEDKRIQEGQNDGGGVLPPTLHVQYNANRLNQDQGQDQQTLERELRYYLEAVTRENSQSLEDQLLPMRRGFDLNTLKAAINQPEYLNKLVMQLKASHLEQTRRLWLSLGRFITPGDHSQSLLIYSLRVVDQFWNQELQRDRAKALLDAMCNEAMKGYEQDWMRLAIANRADLPPECLEQYYYSFICERDLDQREAFRDVVIGRNDQKLRGSFLLYEILSDISFVTSLQEGIEIIERWLKHAQNYRYGMEFLLERGLHQLQEQFADEWHAKTHASRILRLSLQAPLSKKVEDELVAEFLTTFTFGQFSAADSEIYRRYKNHRLLKDEVKTTLSDILALIDGRLDKRQADRLYEQVKMFLPAEYRSVVKECIICNFHQPQFDQKAHINLVKALFTRNHDYAAVFWQIYWDVAAHTLEQKSTAYKFAQVLDCWFLADPGAFQQSYVVHEFFIQLSDRLEKLQGESRYTEGISKFKQEANQSRYLWYRNVDKYFAQKRSIVQSAGAVGVAIIHVAKKLISGDKDNQKSEEEAKQDALRQAYEVEVARLFEKKKALELHVRQLTSFYQESQRNFQSYDPFWSAYWQTFKKIMVSRDAELCLSILVFWFDESFKKLAGSRFISQEFFIGLPLALEEAYQEHERGFLEMAHQLDETLALHWRERYRWYPLVKKNLIGVKEQVK